MKQVKIVPMAAEHLDRLEQLERMCFSRPWPKKMLAEELDNQCAAFLVAVEPETEKAVGYAGLLVVADEGYITNVAVDPPAAGRVWQPSFCRCSTTSQRAIIWRS